MTHFCTHCWQAVPAEAGQCPHCGADGSNASYVDKLLRALNHPVSETRLLAV
jgi:predicted amidophosphoribosyltransferase